MKATIEIDRDDLAAFIDHRLDLAFQRHADKYQPAQDIAPGPAGQTLVSKQTAAKMLGICVASVDNARRSGKLKSYKIGGKSIRFNRDDVLALAEGKNERKQARY